MTKEDILTWLIKFGREWVDWNDVYDLYKFDTLFEITAWHDAAHITKRTKLTKGRFTLRGREYDIAQDQYRLTERAINSLND